MHKFFLAGILMFSATAGSAQPVSISGKITDTNVKAVVSATVSLLKASDSSWVQSTITNEQGGFLFNVAHGNYLINVSALGYKTRTVPVKNAADIEITITKLANELEEVVVKSHAPAIRTSLGKTSLNFENATVSEASDVIELLRRVPGVQVDANGNISLNGKSVLITVNDRQIYLSGEDLKNFLKTLSAKDVAQIDLMNQPSDKYDAASNAGIINIQTKKNREEGWNAGITGSYRQSAYPNTHERAHINFKKGDCTLYGRASYLHATGFLNQETEMRASQNITRERSFYKEMFEDYSLDLGGELRLNEKLSLGGNVQGVYHPNSEKDISNGVLTKLSGNSVIYNHSENERGFIRQYINGNAFTDFKVEKDHRLSAECSYILFDQGHGGQHLTTRSYDQQGQPLPGALQLQSSFDKAMKIFAAKADYSGAFGDKITVEAGLKASVLKNNITALYSVLQHNVWIADTSRSEIYDYNENINAVYVTCNKKLSKRWQVQIGVRAEQTNILGIQETQNRRFEKSFVSIFPTAFAGYKLNDKNSFELNFGRRIQRPSYRELSPFVYYLSQYNYSSGNPDLLPEFRYAVSLKHNYRNMLFTELSYARVTDIISPVISYDEASKNVYNTLINLARKNNVHFSVLFNKEVTNWWTVSSNYNFYHNNYDDTSGSSLAASNGHSISISNQFTFDGWSIFTYYGYNTGDLQSLTERNGPNQWMSATVSKKIWKDTTTIALELNDPFNVYRHKASRNWNGVQSETNMQFATQNASLSFTYNFGKKMEIRQRKNELDESKRM